MYVGLIPLFLWFSTEGELCSLPDIWQHLRDSSIIYLFIIHAVHMCMGMHAAACIWRSEDDFPELVLSFHYMGFRD